MAIDMFFLSPDKPPSESRLFDESLSFTGSWLPSQMFPKDEASSYLDERRRLLWAPLLIPIAFGENTAYRGFDGRIDCAADLSAKEWLCLHLLDEAKHTEAFAIFLRYLYPSFEHAEEIYAVPTEVRRYFAISHGYKLHHWLLSLQIIEVFAKHCFAILVRQFGGDRWAGPFFRQLLHDEQRHVTFIRMLIQRAKQELGERNWRSRNERTVVDTVRLAQLCFLGRENRKVGLFDKMEVDIENLCRAAAVEVFEALDVSD